MKLENKLTAIMSVSIMIISLLIVFNLVNIADNVDSEKVYFKRLSAYAIKQMQENQTLNQTQEQPEAELYSTTSYLAMIIIILTILSLIFIISAVIIFPRIKHLT